MPGKPDYIPKEEIRVIDFPGLRVSHRGDGTVDAIFPDGRIITAPNMKVLSTFKIFRFGAKDGTDMTVGSTPDWNQVPNTSPSYFPGLYPPITPLPAPNPQEKLIEDMAARIERMSVEMQVMHTRMLSLEAEQRVAANQAIQESQKLQKQVKDLADDVDRAVKDREDLVEHNANLKKQHKIITEALEEAEERVRELEDERDSGSFPPPKIEISPGAIGKPNSNQISVKVDSYTDPAVVGRIVAERMKTTGWF